MNTLKWKCDKCGGVIEKDYHEQILGTQCRHDGCVGKYEPMAQRERKVYQVELTIAGQGEESKESCIIAEFSTSIAAHKYAAGIAKMAHDLGTVNNPLLDALRKERN